MKGLLCLLLVAASAIKVDAQTKLWALDPRNPGSLFTGPFSERIAVAGDGTTHGAGGFPAFPGEQSAGLLFAVNTNGTLKWHYDLPNAGVTGPVLGADGNIYINALLYAPTVHGFLVAVNNGIKQWQLTPPGGGAFSGSPALASDGTIWISSGTNLFAVRTNGTVKHTFSLGGSTTNLGNFAQLGTFSPSLAIAANDVVYAPVTDGRVIALKSAGDRVEKLWEFASEPMDWAPPAIGPDGTLYLSQADGNPVFSGRILALNPVGSLRWELKLPAPAPGSPVVASDGTIYAAALDGRLYAINPEGTVRWSAATQEGAFSSPLLDETGSINLLGQSGTLYIISSDGQLTSTNKLGSNASGSALTRDGRLIVYSGLLMNAFSSRSLAEAPWSMLDASLNHAAHALSPDSPVLDLPVLKEVPDAETVRAGHALLLSTVASGTGPLTFQWRKNGTNLVGATNLTLEWKSIALADEGWYSVIASNKDGMAGSPAVRITVLPEPTSPVAPLNITGWNVDVIREAAPPSAAYAFSEVSLSPSLNVVEGSSFFEDGFRNGTNGLPSARTFISALHSNIVFELQPYTSNNVLKLTAFAPSATLNLVSPGRLNFLSLLAMSTINGGGIGEVQLNFTDGTVSGPLPLYAPVWNVRYPRLALGDLSASSRRDGVDTIYRDNSPGFAFYETDFDLATLGLNAKPIASITFTKPLLRARQNITGVFAVSGTPAGPALRAAGLNAAGQFEFSWDVPHDSNLTVQSSSDLHTWSTASDLSQSAGDQGAVDPSSGSVRHRFFRLSLSE